KDKSKAAGMTLRAIEAELDEVGGQVIGLVRNEVRLTAPQSGRLIRTGDILVIEAEVDALANLLSSLGLKLEESVKPEKNEAEAEAEQDEQDPRPDTKQSQPANGSAEP